MSHAAIKEPPQRLYSELSPTEQRLYHLDAEIAKELAAIDRIAGAMDWLAKKERQVRTARLRILRAARAEVQATVPKPKKLPRLLVRDNVNAATKPWLTVTCGWCRKTIKTKRAEQKYCSVRCRAAAKVAGRMTA